MKLRLQMRKPYIFLLGMLAVLVTILPYLFLGEDSVFVYTDQLDGEMIAYVLQAKHLFHGSSIAEFMNGASKTALTVPAPLAVLLFLWGNPCGALIAMTALGKICGYTGMYLLVREVAGENIFCRQDGTPSIPLKWIAALTAFLYSCIPFLAVYGLAESGLPMLFWCALQIRKGKNLAVAFSYTVLYAMCSSLVLIGFGVLGLGLAWIAALLFSRKKQGNKDSRGILYSGMAWLLLFLIYLAENQSLIRQLFGIGETFLTHKSEYALAAQPFADSFLNGILDGVQHGQGYHALLLAGTVLAVAAGNIRSKNYGYKLLQQMKALLKVIYICFGCNLFFAFVSALWGSGAGVYLRSQLSFLGAFQLDRLLWMAPCLWYLAAACGLAVLYTGTISEGNGVEKFTDMRCSGREVERHLSVRSGCKFGQVHFLRERVLHGPFGQEGRWKGSFWNRLALVLATAAFGVTALWSLYSGEFKLNIQKMRNPDYGIFSYREYYAIGVMEQVRDFLDTYTGKGVEEYRIVSLGIDPAAALYHGFYCLDGYSNNYGLDYKKKFREIIAPELDRSEYLRQYFDGWGNRCYLFSSECPGYYTIEKHMFSFRDYQIDTKALYEMGGRYLLSASWIQNAEEQGLALLNDVPFETEDSYYCIYVYEVAPVPADGIEGREDEVAPVPADGIEGREDEVAPVPADDIEGREDEVAPVPADGRGEGHLESSL